MRRAASSTPVPRAWMLLMQLRSASVRPGAWRERDVRADTLRDRQSGAFTDQHHHGARAEQLTDRVADRDTAVAHDRDRRQRPSAQEFLGHDPLDQVGAVPFDRPRRQPVAEHDRQITPLPARTSRRGGGVGRERTAEIRATDVLVARAGRGCHRDRGATGRGQCRDHPGGVEGVTHRVARPGMVEQQPQPRCGRHAASQPVRCPPGPASPPRCARSGARRSSREVQGGHECGALRVGAVRRPRSSTRSIRCSHASNSGAGRRPSTRRRYWASWNDVDLVAEHHVVGARHAHDVAARRPRRAAVSSASMSSWSASAWFV